MSTHMGSSREEGDECLCETLRKLSPPTNLAELLAVGPLRTWTTPEGANPRIPLMMRKSDVGNSSDYFASRCKWYSNSGLLTFRPGVSPGTYQYFLSTCQGQGLPWVQVTSHEPNRLPQSHLRLGHWGHCPICILCIWPGVEALSCSKKLFSRLLYVRGSPPGPRDRGARLKPASSSVAVPMTSQELPRYSSQPPPWLSVRIPTQLPPTTPTYWCGQVPASLSDIATATACLREYTKAGSVFLSYHVCCQIAVHTSVLFLWFKKGEPYLRSPKTLQCHGW